MRNLLALIAVLLIQRSGAIIWIRTEYDRLEGNQQGLIELEVSSNNFCPLDTINVEWDSRITQLSSDIRIGVHKKGSKFVAVGSLEQTTQKLAQVFSSPARGPIICSLNQDHCIPNVKTIAALEKNNRLIVTFAEDTNEPLLLTNSKILEALKIVPPLYGYAVGEWINARELSIVCDPEFIRSVLLFHHSGNKISVEVRNAASIGNAASNWSTGKFSMKLNDIGSFELFLINGTTKKLISSKVSVSVDSTCRTDIVPNGIFDLEHDTSKPETTPPTPFIHYGGILAVSGEKSFSIPNDPVPSMAKGSWSLSFWIRFLKRPAGSTKCMFYKGDFHSAQRTPSAWLIPQVL